MATLQNVDKISTIDYEDSVNVNIEHEQGEETAEQGTDDHEIFDVVTSTSLAIAAPPAAAPTRNKVELKCVACPIETVTVFLDRAEVNRAAETPVEAGENEIVITGLPSVVDEDSVRVQCFGEATIIEVSYKEEIINEEEPVSEEDNSNEIQKLKARKVEFEKQIEQVKQKITVLEKEKTFLINYGDRLKTSPNDRTGEKLADTFDKKSLDGFASFLEFFQTNCDKLNSDIFNLEQASKKLSEDVLVIQQQLEKLDPNGENAQRNTTIDRQVSILLEAENQTELKLVLSYVVTNAQWTPLYDFRAFSKDCKLQLLYFGIIKQTTGEDWNDAKLSLSTAMPSVGGSPPELDAWYIHPAAGVRRGPRKNKMMMSFRKSRGFSEEYDDNVLSSGATYEREHLSLMAGLYDAAPTRAKKAKAPASKPYYEADVSEGITSTCFEIARNSSIKCDNTGHKVSICQIELSPDFEYSSVPKLVAHAFLKANVKNTSNYALLAGPANVFLDNNFLTKSYLEAVSPMEEFEVSLGADPSIKVTYKPLQKHRQTTGLMSKRTQTNYHQEIVIKNTKQSAVKITITDGFPKSRDEKIKVNLIEPIIPVTKNKTEKADDTHKPVKLNDKNQVEWLLDIPPTETKVIHLKYNVDHPVDVDVRGINL
eukprot:gene194-808_t